MRALPPFPFAGIRTIRGLSARHPGASDDQALAGCLKMSAVLIVSIITETNSSDKSLAGHFKVHHHRVTYLKFKVHHFGRGFFSSVSGWWQAVDWWWREACFSVAG